MYEIYTDGAFNPVTQEGGWAAVVLKGGQKNVYSGSAVRTTNNRMEITAALEGLLEVPPGVEVTVYTDSQYLYGCASRGWERKANRDLFEQLDKVSAERKVQWQWIDQGISNAYQKEAHTTATARAAGKETAEPARLSHIDSATGKPTRVDVPAKPETAREATAKCTVRMKAETFALIKQGKVAKGDVLTVAQLAGIMGAKQTPYLIPLCHPLLIGDVRVEFATDEAESTIGISATVKLSGKTGAEMEALTAAALAALTVYDMCKAVDRGMTITDLRLARKSGGKSGTIELE